MRPPRQPVGSARVAAKAEWSGRARCTVILAVSIAALAGTPGCVAGQVSPGVHGSWGSGSDFGLGARLAVRLESLLTGLEIAGIFDYYFPAEGAAANVAEWEASANLVYHVRSEALALTPYGGAGFGVARYTASVPALGTDLQGGETRTGLNLVGGLLFEIDGTRPFLEARVTMGGSDQFALSAGMRF